MQHFEVLLGHFGLNKILLPSEEGKEHDVPCYTQERGFICIWFK